MLAVGSIFLGFILLIWSADKFVDSSVNIAHFFKVPTLLIGMLIIGFGTSAPEIAVSILAAYDKNPGLALGNALGSNIVNIGLVLGITAIISPIIVKSKIVKKELPILLISVCIVAFLLIDFNITRIESWVLLILFLSLIVLNIFFAIKNKNVTDSLESEVERTIEDHNINIKVAITMLVFSLVVLIFSSRILVWGAIDIAQNIGVSDFIIGLTIVALGTSLPELAASVIAVRKGEHDLAIGNIVGSCLFNLLAVISIAGIISPMINLSTMVLYRDWLIMMLLTVMLFFMALGYKRKGRVNRLEGCLLLLVYCSYSIYLMISI